MPKTKRKKIYKKLKNKFRLVILNDSTFEERFSMVLSPLNLFTWGGLLVLMLAFLMFLIIAFTPLRELVPGYGDVLTKKLAIIAKLKADSLEKRIRPTDKYLANLLTVLRGGRYDSVEKTVKDPAIDYSKLNLKPSREDSAFRADIESESAYNLHFQDMPEDNAVGNYFFFTPLNGPVTAEFNLSTAHYGIDITAPENEAVMSTLDGVVILATWTSETGYLIEIQHENGLISIYKHNASLLKKTGEQVKAGEPIAIIGESGKLSSGPHLHFELWQNGLPIDPKQFLDLNKI